MGQKILVVEDSRSFRKQLIINLEKRGNKVVWAENGKEGLDVLSQHQDLDLLIADIYMPVMDGIEMIKKIKSEQLYMGPIMVLTTAGDRGLIKKAKALGVTCWLVKPFDPSVLLRAVDRVLG